MSVPHRVASAFVPLLRPLEARRPTEELLPIAADAMADLASIPDLTLDEARSALRATSGLLRKIIEPPPVHLTLVSGAQPARRAAPSARPLMVLLDGDAS